MIQRGREFQSHVSPKNVSCVIVHGDRKRKAHAIHVQTVPQGYYNIIIGYRLIQDTPAVHEGASDASGMGRAKRADLACQEVLTWFGGDLSAARPPTLWQEEAKVELKWFNSRFEKLRLVHFNKGTILLAILSETKQGEEPLKNEKFETTKIIVPVSHRTAVIAMAHSKVHWGMTKTAEAIADNFAWEKMREDVKKFILQCATCLEKQGINLKEGAHMPRVSHEQ